MTTKEIAEIAGVSVQTVRRTAESRVGFVFVAGKKADFTEKESIEIMRELKKKGFIQPVQNGQVPVQNGQVEQLGVMVANLCMAVNEQMKMMSAQQAQINAIVSKPKEIDFIQDYYSIKGYASKIGQQVNFSDALNLGRIAGKLSRERCIEIRKVDDESFGQVNSYNIAILEEVFQI